MSSISGKLLLVWNTSFLCTERKDFLEKAQRDRQPVGILPGSGEVPGGWAQPAWDPDSGAVLPWESNLFVQSSLSWLGGCPYPGGKYENNEGLRTHWICFSFINSYSWGFGLGLYCCCFFFQWEILLTSPRPSIHLCTLCSTVFNFIHQQH